MNERFSHANQIIEVYTACTQRFGGTSGPENGKFLKFLKIQIFQAFLVG